MGKVIVILLIIVILAAVGYVAFFERDWFMEQLGQAKQQVQQTLPERKVFTPAKTPDEAVKQFREAVKVRDYDAAAGYCGGEYGEQMKKAAASARSLALAIDQLEGSLKPELKSDTLTHVFRQLEPFPTHFQFGQIKRDGDAKATVPLSEELTYKRPQEMSHGPWKVDTLVLRALTSDWIPDRQGNVYVTLKREGEGDAAVWKLYVPVTDKLRQSVNRLVERHAEYVKALDKVRNDVSRDKFTRPEDVELQLKQEIEALK